MTPKNKTVILDDTLSLTECRDGFWLHDTTRGLNLAMRQKTADDAYYKTIKYYQQRLLEVEKELKTLRDKVDLFVDAVTPEYKNALPWD